MKGRFGSVKPTESASCMRSNRKDFKIAKKKLASIQKRAVGVGKSCDFQILCRTTGDPKDCKSFQWKTKDFQEAKECKDAFKGKGVNLEDVSSLQTQLENLTNKFPPEGGVSAVSFCMWCEREVNLISYKTLKCNTKRCTLGIAHFSCLGFPDISVKLATSLKESYHCRKCSAKTG